MVLKVLPCVEFKDIEMEILPRAEAGTTRDSETAGRATQRKVHNMQLTCSVENDALFHSRHHDVV